MNPDPIVQYNLWLADAEATELNEPNAACLATVDEGQPRTRIMLIKVADDRGFQLFTNYESGKGRELAAHPRASLCLYWKSWYRQVRIEGRVEPMTTEESDAYFNARPRGSQVGAWASDQSRPIESREALLDKFDAAEARFEGQDVPRPPHWGGYRLVPHRIEFWQGRENRFHDRWLYQPAGDGAWSITRLQP